MQQQSTTLVLTSTSYHKNADVERPLLNSEINRFWVGRVYSDIPQVH